jgi:mannonate dehydratase
MAVKIERIETIPTAPEGINLLIVKLYTNQPGLYGLGCATFTYRNASVQHLIETYLTPLLTGRDVESINDLWHLMHQNAYWRNGPIENNAISGIDMALWDIKGKMAGMPLYQLFGGKCRQGVPIYRHADGRDSSEVCENIVRLQEQGITFIRCQVGGYGGNGFGKAPASAPQHAPDGVYLNSRQYIGDTIKLFDDIRSKIGFGVSLCHDVHERLQLCESIRLAQALEPYELAFLEDAVVLEQGAWYRQLRAKTSIPLAHGELFNNPQEWRFLIAEQLIDYIRAHITQIGGITPARKLQLFAEQFGVKTAWHGPGDLSPVGHAANIHLDLAAHNFGVQEWSGTQSPNAILQELSGHQGALLEVFEGLPELHQGYVYANEKPGLGIDINEKAAKKYPCESNVTLWTQTRSTDGTLQVP